MAAAIDDPYKPFYGQHYTGLGTPLPAPKPGSPLALFLNEIEEVSKGNMHCTDPAHRYEGNESCYHEIPGAETRRLLFGPQVKATGLNPEAEEFQFMNGTSSKSSPTEAISSKSSFLEPAFSKASSSANSPDKISAASFKPTLSHPIIWNPKDGPASYRVLTEESPECAALGQYLSRPKLAKPSNPFLKADDFFISIRYEGAFDSSGRQPGLPIAQAKQFKLHIVDSKYFVPGQRMVELWRNGETLQLFGLLAVFAGESGWAIGDSKLRHSWNGNYSGRAVSQP